MRELLGIRQFSVIHGRDYYERQVGIVVRLHRWVIGTGYILEVHYWPGLVWSLLMQPASPKVCGWTGCRNKPVCGGAECSDHELPF